MKIESQLDDDDSFGANDRATTTKKAIEDSFMGNDRAGEDDDSFGANDRTMGVKNQP